MGSSMKKLLSITLAVALFALIHEGLHALVAAAFGEYDAFRVRPFGFEVIFRTPVAERQGLHWAAISGVPNAATIVLGFLLLASRRSLASSRNRLVRNTAYWLCLLLLIGDPLNLSVGPFLYGGDALGIAVGLQTDVRVVQALALALFVINRELIAQALLPSFGVTTTHPLLKPLIPLRGASRAA
jgi:hypothetical protein